MPPFFRGVCVHNPIYPMAPGTHTSNVGHIYMHTLCRRLKCRINGSLHKQAHPSVADGPGMRTWQASCQPLLSPCQARHAHFPGMAE